MPRRPKCLVRNVTVYNDICPGRKQLFLKRKLARMSVKTLSLLVSRFRSGNTLTAACLGLIDRLSFSPVWMAVTN